ncbi:MAG: UDP-glucose/GDP-mannose dehydrogenase family protein [Sedimentisphaerales bacterium]|nr:UDP-glucose/GDP-mannose dehydrogenase family protein [Sedimentisphaerales bacterium]
MKVSVVGVGYVGLVAAACLADGGNHVICVDSDKRKIDRLKKGEIPIYEPGLTELVKHNEAAGRLVFTTDLKEGVDNSLVVFLAVGTPSAPDGSADISAVLEVAGAVAEIMDGYRIIVTKSTVPVGTHIKVSEVITGKTENPFDYVSNPEFLKEGSAVEDFLKPDRVIIGTTNPAVREIMKQLYSPFMRKSSRMIFMDPASAEMAKYAANSMLATRISFMNEISALCDTFGADVEQVRIGIGSDSRIGSSFIFPGVGYGGSCFPKDVQALIHMGAQQECPMTIAQAVQQANYVQQDRFSDKVIRYFGEKAGQTRLAVWGLAFKAKTDDIRESPAIRCIDTFLEAGMKIRAYDPEAMTVALEKLKGRIETVKNSYDALNEADALVIFTEWQEFRTPDFEQIAARLKNPVIFDGRNLYDPAYVKKQGIEYHSIGRP